MRVLHFLWSGNIGGAERSVYQLIRRQRDAQGLDVGVLFARARGPYYELVRDSGFPVVALQLGSGRDIRSLRSVVAAIRPYEVHHFHSVEPLLIAASVLSGDKVRVFTERGGEYPYPLRKRVRHWVGGFLLRRFFHGFSGNTRHAVQSAARRYGIAPERFAVTYNGLDFSLLRPARDRDEVRSELGVKPGETVVGTAAHLKDWKRIDYLLRACGSLDGQDVRVLIVGDGPDRTRLEDIAAAEAGNCRAIFTGRHVLVADYLSAMDVFVLPSTALESFGNAAVEAMALGIPSVVFQDSPGLCEHVEHGKTGFIVGGVEQLARAVGMLKRSGELRRTVGQAGARYVRSNYTLDQMSLAYEELYERAREGASAGTGSGTGSSGGRIGGRVHRRQG